MRIVAAALLLAGCATAQSAGPPEVWRVVSVDGEPFGAEARLGFDLSEGRYQGQGPCNRFSGTVTTEPFPAVILSPPAATRMACPELAAEARLFGALARITQMSVGFDDMTLRSPDGGEIALEREAHLVHPR